MQMKVMMMAPYFRMGNGLSSALLAQPTSCSVSQMVDSWAADGLLHTLKQLPVCILLALGAWLLSGLLIVPVLYMGSRLMLRKYRPTKAD